MFGALSDSYADSGTNPHCRPIGTDALRFGSVAPNTQWAGQRRVMSGPGHSASGRAVVQNLCMFINKWYRMSLDHLLIVAFPSTYIRVPSTCILLIIQVYFSLSRADTAFSRYSITSTLLKPTTLLRAGTGACITVSVIWTLIKV